MCGIVGLLLKNPALRPRLGELMVPMMIGMTERGPDSAGLAVFTEPVGGQLHKLSLYAGAAAVDWKQLQARLRDAITAQHAFRVTANHAVLTTSAAADEVQTWLGSHAPELTVLCVGRA